VEAEARVGGRGPLSRFRYPGVVTSGERTSASADRPASSSRVSRPALGIGAGAGLLGGLFGIGGGIVRIPALIGFLGMDRKIAHGTSLAATLPVALASLSTYAFRGNVDWPVAACLASGAIAGAVLGTQLLQVVPKRPLIIIFVAVIVATAVRLVISSEALGRDALTLTSGFALVGIGLVVGTLSGLLGIGGGVIMVPVMVVLFSIPPVVAKGTSLAVIVPSSFVGTLRNRANRNADLGVALAVGGAGIVTAIIGGVLADSIDDTVSNVTFAVLLGIVATIQLKALFAKDPVDPLPLSDTI